ncbi:MAG: signal recognition particle-docking protein FtsY [Myxococcales bacterium]|nr:signal recognition particle-docking protein FtsY [Myxococcales bacterium]
MDTTTLVVIAVVVLAVVVFLIARGSKPQLPEEDTAADRELPKATSAAAEVPAHAAEPQASTPTPKASAPVEPAEAEKAEATGEAKVAGEPQAEAGSEVEAEAPRAAEAAPAEEHAQVAAAQAPAAGSQQQAPVADEPSAAEASAEEQKEAIKAIRKGLASTRGGFIARLAKLFGAKQAVDPELLEEIEEVLITADVGVKTTQRILDDLRAKMESGELSDSEAIWKSLKAQAASILSVDAPPVSLDGSPAVILMVGVNGVGKTTTIGKLASRYAAEGRRVLLAAGDTYRAAAVLQLEMWGKRVDCPVVKGKSNADPSSVIFDAIKKATDEGYDLVIADTAGRLHTKQPLMEEIKKVERTIAKATGGRSADQVFLVLDATTGQNAVQQTQIFGEAVGVTGVVLTKLDGSAKGGVILSIVDQYKSPVRFIGLGEKVEDLREFSAAAFVEALFDKSGDDTMAA